MNTTDIRPILEKIKEITGGDFRKASSTDLEKLSTLKLPQRIISFYEEYEPTECIEFGDIRFLPIEIIASENKDYIPGAIVSEHGYIVFATDFCGDAYCFNINRIDANDNPEIVYIPHSVNFEDKPKTFIDKHAEKVSDSLIAFLEENLNIEIELDKENSAGN